MEAYPTDGDTETGMDQIGIVTVRRGGVPAKATARNALLYVEKPGAPGVVRIGLMAEDGTTWIDIPANLVDTIARRLMGRP